MKNDKTVVTTVDLLPTFCAAAGVTLPADYEGDGENLLGAFNGKKITRTRPTFWEWRGPDPAHDWWPRLDVREEFIDGASRSRRAPVDALTRVKCHAARKAKSGWHQEGSATACTEEGTGECQQ